MGGETILQSGTLLAYLLFVSVSNYVLSRYT